MSLTKQIVQTENAPKAIGPYSQAVEAGGFLFISGQLGIDPVSGNLETGISDQTNRSLRNISAILASRHMSFEDVVKSTIFMVNLGDFSAVNEIYAKYFGADFPARSTIQVAALPKNGLVEIEVIAIIK